MRFAMGVYELAFTMRERVAGGAVVMELVGEIDILAEQTLGPRMEGVASRCRGELVLDLRAVTFLDASGVRLLLRVRARAARCGARLRVVRGGAMVSKVVRIAGVEAAFVWLEEFPPTVVGSVPA
ncbi:STAS domain-containing protein [Streptomyces abikoensis]